MINLENKIERDKLIDDYFNKGYACDIREVYQAIVNTIADLEYANDEKADEIERLKELCDKYEEEHKTTFKEWKKTINIIKEVRHYIKDTKQDGYKLVWIDKDNNYFESGIEEILDKADKEKQCTNY